MDGGGWTESSLEASAQRDSCFCVAGREQTVSWGRRPINKTWTEEEERGGGVPRRDWLLSLFPVKESKTASCFTESTVEMTLRPIRCFSVEDEITSTLQPKLTETIHSFIRLLWRLNSTLWGKRHRNTFRARTLNFWRFYIPSLNSLCLFFPLDDMFRCFVLHCCKTHSPLWTDWLIDWLIDWNQT